MGSIRFERIPPVEGSTKNIIEFDSSYDRAIARHLGLEEGSIELNLVSEDETKRVWEVFGRGFRPTPESDPQPLLKRGRMTALTLDEIWSRTDGGHYGGKF